jgi:hypothetical protein
MYPTRAGLLVSPCVESAPANGNQVTQLSPSLIFSNPDAYRYRYSLLSGRDRTEYLERLSDEELDGHLRFSLPKPSRWRWSKRAHIVVSMMARWDGDAMELRSLHISWQVAGKVQGVDGVDNPSLQLRSRLREAASRLEHELSLDPTQVEIESKFAIDPTSNPRAWDQKLDILIGAYPDARVQSVKAVLEECPPDRGSTPSAMERVAVRLTSPDGTRIYCELSNGRVDQDQWQQKREQMAVWERTAKIRMQCSG